MFTIKQHLMAQSIEEGYETLVKNRNNVILGGTAFLRLGNKNINIGIAVAIEEGLIAPVVKNADKKSLSTLSEETKKLIELARERKLMPDDYKGGTFTVSNLGMYGIEEFTSIINPPEAAILAVGAAKKVPIVIEEESKDKIEIRSIAKFTLSVDHRLIDGVIAVKFLNQLKYYLEFPEAIVFEEDASNL